MPWRCRPMADVPSPALTTGTLQGWYPETNQPPRVLYGHKAGVYTVDRNRAVSGSADRTVRVWDLEGTQPPRILEGHTNPVNAVALSADGKRAIGGSDSGEYSLDHTLRVRELESNEAPRVLKGWRTEWEGTQGTINAVALSADGQRAVVGSARAGMTILCGSGIWIAISHRGPWRATRLGSIRWRCRPMASALSLSPAYLSEPSASGTWKATRRRES